MKLYQVNVLIARVPLKWPTWLVMQSVSAWRPAIIRSTRIYTAIEKGLPDVSSSTVSHRQSYIQSRNNQFGC